MKQNRKPKKKDTYKCSQLIFDKEENAIQWRKESF